MSEISKLSSVSMIKPTDRNELAEKNNNPNKANEDKLRQVSEMYENYFVREMMKQMRATVQEGGFIKQNNAEKIFRGQLDEQYADQWVKSGGIGLSNLIYDQLVEKFGHQYGFKKNIDKPVGPLAVDNKSAFTGFVSRQPESEEKRSDEITMKFQSANDRKSELLNPWAGTLLSKNYLDMDQIQYRIKHDNGLESLIMTRGSGLGPEHKLSPGDAIGAGQQLGWLSSASPLFWTVKSDVSE